MRYWPAAFVVTDRTCSISAGLDASTPTPGSTAPDVSRATPVIDACAWRSEGMRRSPTEAHAIFSRGIQPPGRNEGRRIIARSARVASVGFGRWGWDWGFGIWDLLPDGPF